MSCRCVSRTPVQCRCCTLTVCCAILQAAALLLCAPTRLLLASRAGVAVQYLTSPGTVSEPEEFTRMCM